ncbi:hypothetical protein COA17_17235 [Sphingomonas ginsenosidimutans]|jgi:hypothetical protein|uniref:Uncharacterized protein n=1 Tax=Sphingomonas ginsenosidimutans TaxID=862134 RepID=A0A2A4HRV3_9SPHN|nr:DUF6528 family protein [Sphingomonas ginsenosidimutans]PCG07632.1 hypothetical protein COA17_17235 [Sphingomonas ginsenosidimutans]
MLISVILFLAAVSDPAAYACGDDQVRELRLAPDGPVEVWRWTARDAQDLPADYRTRLMAHIDECKPVDDGRAILVTASTGGAVLIDRASGRVTFRARVPMAHSADLLPGGRIAVALSIAPRGDRLQLFDRQRSEQVVQTLPLPSGHGVVWDAQRHQLFALSHDLVQAFRLTGKGRAARLIETARWTLPGRRDGHDLSSAGGGRYYVTTDDGAWRFDPDDGSFIPYAPLNPALRVKAVSMTGGRVAWVQAEEKWWASGFTVMAADGSDQRRIALDGIHLYKVRWVR